MLAVNVNYCESTLIRGLGKKHKFVDLEFVVLRSHEIFLFVGNHISWFGLLTKTTNNSTFTVISYTENKYCYFVFGPLQLLFYQKPIEIIFFLQKLPSIP